MPIEMQADGGAIDRDHLERATFGDRALQLELLGMLLSQVCDARSSLPALRGPERVQLAHALKGSARGLGAFALAQCAADIEIRPDDDAVLQRFSRLADELEISIAGLDA